MNEEKGLVILYTGEGKGKTTAALGLVLRAVGYKKKCLIIQFGKTWFTGELVGIKKLSFFPAFFCHFKIIWWLYILIFHCGFLQFTRRKFTRL